MENSRLFQKTLRKLLEEVGCTVDCVSSCDEGLQLLQFNNYRLIIAGQNVFDTRNTEFIEYCRKNRRLTHIILLTSEPNERLLSNAHDAGIRDIFPKTNIDLLRDSIRYYISGKKEISIEGGRVLYVEDSSFVARVIERDLRKLNLEVDHFSNAEDAFAALSTNEYDLVITDLRLSGTVSGLSLVRLIRAHTSEISELPVLAMTGDDDAQRRIELFHAGINDYVTKPPVLEELAARVNNLINNKRLFDKVQEQKQTLQKLALQDQLTGCHNRHSLVENAPKYIQHALHNNYSLSLVIFDLDYFKEVNDQHGHDVGDVVLKDVGKLLNEQCRKGDFVARIGGEEFLILFPHCNEEETLKRAEHLRQKLENTSLGGVFVTASLGVSILNDSNMADFNSLYKAADEAVYISKKCGRNRVTISD